MAIVEALGCAVVLPFFVGFVDPGRSALTLVLYWWSVVACAVWLPWSLFGIVRSLRSPQGFVFWIMDSQGVRSPDFEDFPWADVAEVGPVTNPVSPNASQQDRFVVTLTSGRKVTFRRKPRGFEMATVQSLASRYLRNARRPDDGRSRAPYRASRQRPAH